jgi:predicted lipopolysaccharide heptosyltransferase III
MTLLPSTTQPTTAAPVKLERIRKILLIRLRRIGDVVTVTPCTRAIKESFPDAHFAMLVEKASEGVLLGNPYLDEIIVFERAMPRATGRLEHLWNEIKFLLSLRRRGFDLVINLHGGPRSSVQTLISGARYRLGGFIDWHHWNWVYNIRTRPLRETLGEGAQGAHIVERHLATLKAAGIQTTDPGLVMLATRAAQASLDALLQRKGVRENGRLVTIHPASRSLIRRWREGRFAEVADRLVEEFGATVTLVSGPGEEAVTQKVQGAMRHKVVDLGGMLSIQELAALLSRSSLFIGLDGAPTHIAAAMGTPVVALYGPTSDTWRPWTDRGVVLRGPEPCLGCVRSCVSQLSRCMDGISVESVIDAIHRLRVTHRFDADRVDPRECGSPDR